MPRSAKLTQLWRDAGVRAVVVAASLTNHITEIRPHLPGIQPNCDREIVRSSRD